MLARRGILAGRQGWVVLAGLLLPLLAGCGIEGDMAQDRRARAASERGCAPQGEAFGPPVHWQEAGAGSPATARSRLRHGGFTEAGIAAADAIGATGLLLRLVTLEEAVRPRSEDLLRVRLDLTDAILLGILDVASTLAEIDCEDERGDQLRGRLQAVVERRSYRINLATILTGAATAAATGGLSFLATGAAANIVGIVGGAAESGLGLASLAVDASGTLRTPRNLLAEIWARPVQPRLLPGSVWRYLNQPDPAAPEAPTRLDRLIAEWHSAEILGDPGSETEQTRAALLFGTGGPYSAGDLDIREAMLELLQSSVALMHQDLRSLLMDVARGPAARRTRS